MFNRHIVNPIKGKFFRILLAIIQISIFFCLCYSLSILIYYFIYQRLLPAPVIHSQVYFDFGLEHPKALISLSSLKQQWSNLKMKHTLGTGTRSLKSGFLYDIEAIVRVSKSPRNIDLGKVALTTTIIDHTAEAIAKSVRPIVIPYYSDTYIFLETIFNFPTRFFDFPTSADSSSMYISIMKDYQEPSFTLPPSELIELHLSNSLIDVMDMELIILPHLNLFRWDCC
jgi:hypothetical protein